MSLSIRLEADGLEALTLDPFQGYVVQGLDLGDAATRGVAEDAPDANGTIDTTLLHGARAITLQVKLTAAFGTTREQLRRRLRAFTAPSLRPIMYVTIDGEDEQRILLRRGAWTNQIGSPGASSVAIQWIAPYGIIEAAVESTSVAYASGAGEYGRTYNLLFDRTYPSSATLGSINVTNDGNIDAYPLLRVYGPCTNPSIENATQDKALIFTGMTVAAGQFLEIDTRAKTIRYQGDPADSRYDDLVFSTSKWWTLSPGENVLIFQPATYTSPSQTQIVWRSAWL